MIIKSMSRKEASFRQLVEYMERGTAEVAFSHNLCSNPYGRRDDIIREFERNAEFLRARKNGNALYHEVISLQAGGDMSRDAACEALSEIGREYLYRRAPRQMALGMVHSDGPYLHLHICMSANAVGQSKRERLSRQEFAQVQKSVEDLVLVRWTGLGQGRVYSQVKERAADRLKNTAAEQEMRRRRGEPTRKEAVKAQVHGALERAASPDELVRLLGEAGLDLYQRGKTIGIVDRETGRRHRLSTLGVEPHYAQTVARLTGRRADPHREDRAAAATTMKAAEALRDEERNSGLHAANTARAGERERTEGQGTEPPYTRAADEQGQGNAPADDRTSHVEEPVRMRGQDEERDSRERRRQELENLFRHRDRNQERER